jgi:hypothetical protein
VSVSDGQVGQRRHFRPFQQKIRFGLVFCVNPASDGRACVCRDPEDTEINPKLEYSVFALLGFLFREGGIRV